MQRKNLFNGDSGYAAFTNAAYKLLKQGNWVTYADILAEAKHLKSAKELQYSVSKDSEYGELRKAVPDTIKAIQAIEGKDSIFVEGTNRDRKYKYVGKSKDPLADLRNERAVNDLRRYLRFCQDSAGFFPESWLKYFFSTQDFVEFKTKKDRGVISVSIDRILNNIEFLPFLYEQIIEKNVLSICYKPYNEEESTLIFHPHFLKEYNGRWYLYGHAEGKNPEHGYSLALDRIQARPTVYKETEYIPAPADFYKNYFENLVGVTHSRTREVLHIVLRTTSNYMYNLLNTKPLHPSHTVIKPFGKYEDGEYGLFSIDAEKKQGVARAHSLNGRGVGSCGADINAQEHVLHHKTLVPIIFIRHKPFKIGRL